MSQVDDELLDELDLWFLVINKVATWKELNDDYTMDDVEKATAAFSIHNKIQNELSKPPGE